MEFEEFQKNFDSQAGSDNWRTVMAQLTRKELEEFLLKALSRRKRLETELKKLSRNRRI